MFWLGLWFSLCSFAVSKTIRIYLGVKSKIQI